MLADCKATKLSTNPATVIHEKLLEHTQATEVSLRQCSSYWHLQQNVEQMSTSMACLITAVFQQLVLVEQ
jgi:hypothetical protein